MGEEGDSKLENPNRELKATIGVTVLIKLVIQN